MEGSLDYARHQRRSRRFHTPLIEPDRHRWKDYRDGNQHKTMTLTAEEFIRRFLIHVLPQGFQRIRYYGFLGISCRKQKLARCRELLKVPPPPDPQIAPSTRIIATTTSISPAHLSKHAPSANMARWSSSKSSKPSSIAHQQSIPHEHPTPLDPEISKILSPSGDTGTICRQRLRTVRRPRTSS